MGAFVMSAGLHHYGFMTICPDLAGLRCYIANGNPSCVASQLGHQVRSADMYRQEVCEVLGDWQTSCGRPGVHVLPYRPQRPALNQHAITLVWLAHAPNPAVGNLIRGRRHAGA